MEGAQPSDHSLAEAAALIEHRLDPAAIVLFGSAVEDRLRSDSDLDLAVLLGDRETDAFDLAALRVDLAAIVGREVDLVVLDTASPILAMEVLRSHRILSRRDPQTWQRFVPRALGAYFDLKRVRQPIEAAIERGPTGHE